MEIARRAADPDPDPAGLLVSRVRDLLASTLGAFPKFSRAPTRLSLRLDHLPPAVVGLGTGMLYLLLFCLLPITFFGGLDLHLIWLSAFGAAYLALAVAAARATSGKVLGIIRDDIVPRLAPATLLQIDRAMERRFPDRPASVRALLIALLGTIAGGVAIAHDLPQASPAQILWWSIGWFILFVTAARATDVARFYQEFSRPLSRGEEALYPFVPATSLLILDVARLGRAMLAFWLSISASITLMIPFLAMADVRAVGLDRALGDAAQSSFVRLVMPITIFFSGIFGTAVFLGNEAAVRKATDRSLRQSLLQIEGEIASLCRGRFDLDEPDAKRVDRLATIRAELLRSGRYSSFLISGLSLLIPFIGSIVPIVKLFTGSKP